jgi:hypothetical protein
MWLLLEGPAFAFAEGFTALEALFSSTALKAFFSAFPVTKTFTLRLGFGFFWWQRLFVFLADFLNALVNFYFEVVADEVFVSKRVCACCDG